MDFLESVFEFLKDLFFVVLKCIPLVLIVGVGVRLWTWYDDEKTKRKDTEHTLAEVQRQAKEEKAKAKKSKASAKSGMATTAGTFSISDQESILLSIRNLRLIALNTAFRAAYSEEGAEKELSGFLDQAEPPASPYIGMLAQQITANVKKENLTASPEELAAEWLMGIPTSELTRSFRSFLYALQTHLLQPDRAEMAKLRADIKKDVDEIDATYTKIREQAFGEARTGPSPVYKIDYLERILFLWRKAGYYRALLQREFDKNSIDSILLENMCAAYFRETEDLEAAARGLASGIWPHLGAEGSAGYNLFSQLQRNERAIGFLGASGSLKLTSIPTSKVGARLQETQEKRVQLIQIFARDYLSRVPDAVFDENVVQKQLKEEPSHQKLSESARWNFQAMVTQDAVDPNPQTIISSAPAGCLVFVPLQYPSAEIYQKTLSLIQSACEVAQGRNLKVVIVRAPYGDASQLEKSKDWESIKSLPARYDSYIRSGVVSIVDSLPHTISPPVGLLFRRGELAFEYHPSDWLKDPQSILREFTAFATAPEMAAQAAPAVPQDRQSQLQQIYRTLLQEVGSKAATNRNMRDLLNRYADADSSNVEKKLEGLCGSLIDFAGSDQDAREIVNRWNIKRP